MKIKEYEFKESIYCDSEKNAITIRCPDCKNHGRNIATRGDCKNLIKNDEGFFMQCQCYSKEHKIN